MDYIYIAKLRRLGSKERINKFDLFSLNPASNPINPIVPQRDLNKVARRYMSKRKYLLEASPTDTSKANLSYEPPIDILCEEENIFKVSKLSAQEIKEFERHLASLLKR